MQTNFLDTAAKNKLSKGFPDKMVLLDCETTGGKATYHRIIEVGLIIIENGEIIETCQSYINPECSLPGFIQDLTGISPEALKTAPTFKEISDQLLSKLNDRVLVAHNARFDYGFLKNEFARINIKYSTKPLCSVKFSRSMFPQFRRHSLDQIIKRFKFNIDNRHRAYDDALMIYKFFLSSTNLFTENEIKATCDQLIKSATLPALLDPQEIKKLPNTPGVYFFYDDKGLLLYIGKSVNIKNRVLNHFSQDYKNHKDLRMSSRIAHIDFTNTPTDFGAQLLESQKIKELQPIFNSRLRKVKKLLQIKLKENLNGFLIPAFEEVQLEESFVGQVDKFGLFRNKRQASAKLEKLADQFFLCHQLLGLEASKGKNKPCFRFQLKRCLGACCKQESVEQYNQRLHSALKGYRKQAWPFDGPIVVIETGRFDKKSEQADIAFHLLDQWVYLSKLSSIEDLNDYGLACVINDQSLIATNNTVDRQIPEFDLDTYFILIRFILNSNKHELHGLKVLPLRYI